MPPASIKGFLDPSRRGALERVWKIAAYPRFARVRPGAPRGYALSTAAAQRASISARLAACMLGV
jgi:hypothetical protein